jgi:hypothetical protein
MDWKKGIVDGLKLVGVMGVLVIGVMLALIVALIITGIMNDTVVPALNLSNDTTNNITAVVTTVFDFIASLNSGLGIVGALVLIAIVIAVFGLLQSLAD